MAGNNPTLYGYVHDSNSWVDVFGLDLHHIIPQQVYKQFKTAFDAIPGFVQNVSKKAADVANLINLDKPFHGNHPKYNNYVRDKVQDLLNEGNLDLKSIKKLQSEMLDEIKKAKQLGLSLNDYFKELIKSEGIKCK